MGEVKVRVDQSGWGATRLRRPQGSMERVVSDPPGATVGVYPSGADGVLVLVAGALPNEEVTVRWEDVQ